MYIIDRDGVLFDTCELNIKSYSEAADLLKLKTNIVNLTNSIHAGDSYSRFCRNVWQDIDQNDVIKLSKIKQDVFRNNLGLAVLNVDFISRYLKDQRNLCLLTKASKHSTLILLNHFGVSVFGEDVYSTQDYEQNSKIIAINDLQTKRSLGNHEVTIIDDSVLLIEDLVSLGYDAIHYPHYCSMKG